MDNTPDGKFNRKTVLLVLAGTGVLLVLILAVSLLLVNRKKSPNQSTALSGVVQVVAGGESTCALIKDGSVKCWGKNEFGQLGDGTTRDRNTPVAVVGIQESVKAIALGGDHACALSESGAVQCWGKNDVGQLGNGTTQDSLSPVMVAGLESGVAAIAASAWDGTTCALTVAGGVKCWGDNFGGQIGDGSADGSPVPVDVSGLDQGVTAIAVGQQSHVCALTAQGKVVCWGTNGAGQLGDGTTENRSQPVEVRGLTGRIVQITAGFGHTCALDEAGEVFCWGLNDNMQLGDGTTNDSSSPLQPGGVGKDILAIYAGSGHNCLLTKNGRVRCWGENWFGQLGNGTTDNSSAPVEVGGLDANALQVSTGAGHTCALLKGGKVKCWGLNSKGQLGDGTTQDASTPVGVVTAGR
jgi:alpha-tubulin suppressor-like RCC1 family protein